MSAISFEGVYRFNLFDHTDVWNIWDFSYCWMNNRQYWFTDAEEGKAFYDYWNKTPNQLKYGKERNE